MATNTFDTLAQAENLQKYGFNELQAKGLVQVIKLSQENLASKQDLNELEKHIKLEMRLEIHEGFAKLDNKFAKLDNKIAKLDNKILQMTISLGCVTVVAVGLCTGLLKWIS